MITICTFSHKGNKFASAECGEYTIPDSGYEELLRHFVKSAPLNRYFFSVDNKEYFELCADASCAQWQEGYECTHIRSFFATRCCHVKDVRNAAKKQNADMP